MESRPPAPLSRRSILKLASAAAVGSAIASRHGRSLADPDFREDPRNKFDPGKWGGTFHVRIDQAAAHFDPHQTAAYSTMVPLSFAYSRLVKIEAGSSVTPGKLPVEGDLAEAWDSQNESVYVFKLRKGVRWHAKPPVNGRELTSEDVKYTYERFLGTKANPNRAVLDVV